MNVSAIQEGGEEKPGCNFLDRKFRIRKTIKKRATANKRADIFYVAARLFLAPAWKLQFSRSDYVSNRARATSPSSRTFFARFNRVTDCALRSQEIAIIDSKDSTLFHGGDSLYRVSRKFHAKEGTLSIDYCSTEKVFSTIVIFLITSNLSFLFSIELLISKMENKNFN